MEPTQRKVSPKPRKNAQNDFKAEPEIVVISPTSTPSRGSSTASNISSFDQELESMAIPTIQPELCAQDSPIPEVLEISYIEPALILWKRSEMVFYVNKESTTIQIDYEVDPVVKDTIFERLSSQTKLEPPISISHVFLDEQSGIMVGNNYGFVTRINDRFTKKVHSNEVTCIAKRGDFILTCSMDATAIISDKKDFTPLNLLKDTFHLKHPIEKGEFIDDTRVVVASKSFVKVYYYGIPCFRIKSALLTVQIGKAQCVTLSRGLVLFSDCEHRLRMLVVESSKPYYLGAPKTHKHVHQFCLLNPKHAIVDGGAKYLRCIRLIDSKVVWKVDKQAIMHAGKKDKKKLPNITQMLWDENSQRLYVRDEESCLHIVRLPLEDVNSQV